MLVNRENCLSGELQQQLVAAFVDAEESNPDSHAAEVAMAKGMQTDPEILLLRYRRVKGAIELLGAQGGVLLDAGAGKGLNAALAVIAGVNSVYAVEMEPKRYRSAELFLERLKGLGIADRVTLVHGDILDICLPEADFDAAWTWEVLEHIARPLQFHQLLYGWLRRGGRVYHRTGANGANRFKTRLSFAPYWDEVDRLVLAPIRETLILELAEVEIPRQELESLVQATRGLVKDEIVQVVRLWQRSGVFQGQSGRSGRVPRHPLTGEFFESPVHPHTVTRKLKMAGFSARILTPDFRNIYTPNPRKLQLFKVAGWLISRTHPLSLPIAPWIEVFGEKPL